MKLKKPSKAKLRKGEEIAGGGIGIENYNPKRFKKCGSLKRKEPAKKTNSKTTKKRK